jgi:hypothetical protein
MQYHTDVNQQIPSVPSSRPRQVLAQRMHAFPRSSVLVLENDFAVSSLIPSTLVDQVDALLDAHRIDDAAVLVDQRRRKLEENLTVDPDEVQLSCPPLYSA